MFRLQDNVPDIYVDKSRDFQLFCRLYDSVFGGVKFSIDSLQNASSTRMCDESLLPLLKTKVGLFTDLTVDSDELRSLLEAFPYIIRYKGSKLGLDRILNVYSRIMKISGFSCSYDIAELKNFKLKLIVNKKPENDKLLLELLKIILPSGYIVDYEISDVNSSTETLYVNDKLEVDADISYNKFAKVRSRDDSLASSFESLIGVSRVADENINDDKEIE